MTFNLNILSEQILDQLPGGIVVLDQELRIKHCNRWFVNNCEFGLDSLNQNLLKIFPKLQNSRIEKALQNCLQYGLSNKLSSRLLDVFFPIYNHIGTVRSHLVKQSIEIYALGDEKRFIIVHVRYGLNVPKRGRA